MLKTVEFPLSYSEIARQQALMVDLRQAHQQEIIDSGLAERMIALCSKTNHTADPRKITDNTTLFPMRMPLAKQRTRHVKTLAAESGIKAPIDVLCGTHDDPTFQLTVIRNDVNLFSGTRRSGYMLGLQLSDWTLPANGGRRFAPVEGIETKDMFMIQQQLGEIATLRENLELSLVDPDTLGEDIHAYIG